MKLGILLIIIGFVVPFTWLYFCVINETLFASLLGLAVGIPALRYGSKSIRRHNARKRIG